MDLEKRYVGKVKWFDAPRGYGFAVCPEILDNNGEMTDIFIHFSFIQADGFRTLTKNQEIEFTLREVGGKLQAHDVVVR